MEFYKEHQEEILKAMVGKLSEMPMGSWTTTARLFYELYENKELEFGEMMELHSDLIKAAKKAGIKLDMSSHDGLVEGLPFNLDFELKPYKARKKKNYSAKKSGIIEEPGFFMGEAEDVMDEQSLWNLFVVASANDIEKDEANKIICQLIKQINKLNGGK